MLFGCDKFNYRCIENIIKLNRNLHIWIELEASKSMPQYLLDLGLARVEKYSDNEKNTWRYPKLEIKPEKKSGCFIATATMGSYDHPMVMELRGFRDNWILQKSWGEGFVKWYYHYGAIIAKVIEKSFILKKLSYLFIVKPLVCMSKIIKYLNH